LIALLDICHLPELKIINWYTGQYGSKTAVVLIDCLKVAKISLERRAIWLENFKFWLTVLK
jgi:hypothetical protein